MTLFSSWIASIVLVFILPLYGTYIFDLFKNHDTKKGTAHGLVCLAMATIVFFLGWRGITVPTASAARRVPKLESMSKNNFEEEFNLRQQQNLLSPQTTNQSLQLIKIKLDEAEYAQQKGDFDRALKLYSEIGQGSDENGVFGTFQSSCVMNNMAVAYFRKQVDKGFKASTLLFDALRVEPKPAHEKDIIQRNIDALDGYVNQ